jgi:hypothetical protein
MLGDRLPTVFGVEFDMKAFSISRALAVVSLATLPVAVFAQTATPTDPFTAAMTEATAKVGTYALALVGLAAVGVVFMIALKYVKKIPKAA